MDKPRRVRLGERTAAAVLAASLVVVSATLISDRAESGYDPVDAAETASDGGANTEGRVGVDGSLPTPPQPDELMIEMPDPGPLGIPGSLLGAYRQAADRLAQQRPGCGIDWALLASIGRSESNHARGGFVDRDGTTRERILGPVLNGGPGVAQIRDTDGGELDGDATWDRAVGPMQFIPSTWRKYGVDGTDNGRADPNNVHDATLTAGRYLCAGGQDLRADDQLRQALHRYNNSRSYVETVIRWAQAYRDGVLSVPDSDVPLGAPPEVIAGGDESDQRRAPQQPDVMAAPEPNTPSPGGSADGNAGGDDRPGGRPGQGGPTGDVSNGSGQGGSSGDGGVSGGDSGGGSHDGSGSGRPGDGNPGGGQPGDGRPGGGAGDGGKPGEDAGDGSGSGNGDHGENGSGGDGSGDHGGEPGNGGGGQDTPPDSTPPTTPPVETSPSPTPPPECTIPETPDAQNGSGQATAPQASEAESSSQPGSAPETTQPSKPGGDTPEPEPCVCPSDSQWPGEEVDDAEDCLTDAPPEESTPEQTPRPTPEQKSSGRDHG